MTLATEDLEVLIERCEHAVLRHKAGRRASFEAAMDAGKMLVQIKDRIEHGDWLAHLEKLHISERTAQRWMRIGQWSINVSTIIELGGVRATDEAINKVIFAELTDKVQSGDMSIQEALAQIDQETKIIVEDGVVTVTTIANRGQEYQAPPVIDYERHGPEGVEEVPGINNVDAALQPTAPRNPPPPTTGQDANDSNEEEPEAHPATITLKWDKYVELRDRPLQLTVELESVNEQVRLLSEANSPDPDTSAIVAQQRDLINYLETELRKIREERNTYHDLSRRQSAMLNKLRGQEGVDAS